VLDGGPTLDVCSDSSYAVFINHWGLYRNRIDGLLGINPAARWLALRGACGGNTVVIPSGLTLVNGSFLNLASLGVVGLNTVNVCSYGSWNAFDGLYGTRLTRFGTLRSVFGANPFGVWNSLRLRAHCGTTIVNNTVVVPGSVQVDPQVDPAPATPVSTPAPVAPAPQYSAAPAPSSGSGVVSNAPTVAPATGDGSLAV
jgi:hypothetical protein